MSRHRRTHNNESNDRMNNFDLSNFDMNQMGNLLNNIDMNQLSSIIHGFTGSSNSSSAGKAPSAISDRRVQLLNAIKPLVDAEKSKLIDSILQIYTITSLMKK
ncbi:hypothetical protein M2651_01955 [Clostridium sp. SYSU_GA19001]|uniref:hypothetical protein n=1 Tax=Clostridium caldaquaticum TaxID=2940653 RepID=UPI0020776C52|nr:hypothetical protein [Clostridium caldaquaticum]MCM8709785.1 hypothetical protein [Clostridium caldaquaticum]